MRQVGEQLVAEGIVADVLDDAASVGIRPGMLEFRRRQGRVAALQERNDRLVPGEIDELLVRQQRISAGRIASGAEDKREEDCRKHLSSTRAHQIILADRSARRLKPNPLSSWTQVAVGERNR
jgi:hypothetical protein